MGFEFELTSGSPQQLSKPLCVVSPEFVSPNPIHMLSGKKLLALSDGNFGVTDVNGNLMFKLKGKLLSVHGKRLLVDGAGNRILTLQKRLTSARKRWQCFRGDSTNPRDHVFSAKQVNRTQFKTSLDVFLASNRNQDVADFTVKGNWFEKRCTVYVGETTTVIAEINKKQDAHFMAFGVDNYTITVYPSVDYVFVVALIAILNEINDDKDDDDEK
ncbi:putative tubby-like protein [Helianthus anomalus]